MWQNVVHAVSWLIGDGSKVRFWKDTFIPNLGPLELYATCEIPADLYNATAASFSLNGSWNWDFIRPFLDPPTCYSIAAVPAPLTNGDPDKPVWSCNSDGTFSISSAYSLLDGPSLDDFMDPLIPKLIWNWNGPERMKLFLWKVLHGRLLTNDERCRRGMIDDPLCPRCKAAPETLTHVLRDCEIVNDFWSPMIDDDNWVPFFSLGGLPWLLFNLSLPNMHPHLGDWRTVFIIAAWSI
ncbi:hypothetical protein RIF29_31017 [Crotalaria pallida]|uniref:Reverse transcriptase zinc-binding domain-containing protein n=1 Tax=Crotalaria pallida TaxID=3830 RepID=A0AAN9HV09_CROPI